jgi:hypothetical protein
MRLWSMSVGNSPTLIFHHTQSQTHSGLGRDFISAFLFLQLEDIGISD